MPAKVSCTVTQYLARFPTRHYAGADEVLNQGIMCPLEMGRSILYFGPTESLPSFGDAVDFVQLGQYIHKVHYTRPLSPYSYWMKKSYSRKAVSARLTWGEAFGSPTAGEVRLEVSSASRRVQATYRTFMTIGSELTATTSAN